LVLGLCAAKGQTGWTSTWPAGLLVGGGSAAVGDVRAGTRSLRPPPGQCAHARQLGAAVLLPAWIE